MRHPATRRAAGGRRASASQALAWLLMLASLPVLAQTAPGTPPKVPSQPAEPTRSSGKSSAVGVGAGVQIDLNRMFHWGRRLLHADPPPAYAPGRILLAFDADGPLQAPALAAEAGLRLVETARLEALGLTVAELEGSPDRLPATLQRLRTAHPELTADLAPLWHVQGGAPRATPVSSGQSVGRLYAATLLGIRQPQPLPAPVRVAVLDGAVDPAVGLDVADMLQTRIAAGDDPDPDQHGTGVACLLACRMRGPAGAAFFGPSPGLILLNAAVLGRDAQGRPQARALDVLRGLDWSLREGAQILNVSLGAAPDAVTARAFARARPRLAAIIAAAGNGGPDGAPVYPAALPGVIAVAGVDARLRPYRDGSRGDWITLAAPGVEVWTPGRGDDGGRYRTGTSFAAPFVTAWAAQRLARGLPIDADTLCAGARDIPPAGRDVQTGCGLLQWGDFEP